MCQQRRRLNTLRRIEAEIPDFPLHPHVLLRFEMEHCGTPISTFPELHDEYAVLEVDDRYSPKVRLYNIASGRTGVMKLKKALFSKQPLAPGSILKLTSWERRPSYRFVDGKAQPQSDTYDLWITSYHLL